MNQTFSQIQSVALLSLVKLLERASYYGMRALLILYAVDEVGLGLETHQSYTYFGFFTAAVYLCSIPMAIISDFGLKQRNGTLLGLLFSLLGYSLLIIPNIYAALAALLMISIGVGLINPNMTVLVGNLFKKEDEKRNIGFVIYLTAINIGSFIAVLAFGYIGQTYGYHYGFGLAAFSTLLALIIFSVGKNRFGLIETNEVEIAKTEVDKHPEILDYKVGNPPAFITRTPPPLPHIRQANQGERFLKKILLILLLSLVSMVFWQLYEMSMGQLYAKFTIIDSLSNIGLTLPESSLYSLQTIFIIPVTILLLILLSLRIVESSINMIAAAFVLMALNMALIYFGNATSDLSVVTITTLSFMTISIAEWFITAISLSYVTRLSHVKYASTIVAVYFAITFVGGRVIAFLGFNNQEVNLLFFSAIPVLIGVAFFVLRKGLLQLADGLE